MTSAFRLDSDYSSDQGLKKPNNEDFVTYFEPGNPDDLVASGCLYIVADGVGGAVDGERASRYAAQKVKFEYYQHPELEPGDRLRRAIRQANIEIFEYASSHGSSRRMATTMVAAVIRGSQLTVANVGDSRAYLIRESSIQQITYDHTSVGEMVKNGVITEEESMHARGRNRLYRAVGAEDDVQVDVFSDIPIQTGDKILLCSDGLTRYIMSNELPGQIGNLKPKESAERLVKFANNKGGQDNVSVLQVSILEPITVPMIDVSEMRGQLPAEVDWEIIETQAYKPPSRFRLNKTSSDKVSDARKFKPYLMFVAIAGIFLIILTVALGLRYAAPALMMALNRTPELNPASQTKTAGIPTFTFSALNTNESRGTETAIYEATRVEEDQQDSIQTKTIEAQSAESASQVANSTQLAESMTQVYSTQQALDALITNTYTMTETANAELFKTTKHICIYQIKVGDTLPKILDIKYSPNGFYRYFVCKLNSEKIHVCTDPENITDHNMIYAGRWLEIPDVETSGHCTSIYKGEWAILNEQ